MRALAISLALAIGCGTPSPGPGLDIDRALALIHDLSITIGPRPTGSTSIKLAITRIEDELRGAGVEVDHLQVGNVQLPRIVVLGTTMRPGRRVVVNDPNIVLRFGPRGHALLFMAHYDSVDLSPGATDNAASVALLVELARVLQREPPPFPVMIVFTAAEEIGLVGAEALAARNGTEIGFAIALDLIGGDGQLVVNGASELIGDAELGWLADAADRAGIHLEVPAVHRVISRWMPRAERSDHAPFTRRGTPAVHFYSRGNDGEWIDLAYHSDRDVPSRVHRHSLDEMGRLLRALVATPPPGHDGDGYWLPIVTNRVIPRGVLLAIEVLLALVALFMLVLSRDGLLAQITGGREDGGERTGRGPALLAGVGCYVAAAIITIAIERLISEHPVAWLHAPGTSLVAYGCLFAGTLGLVTRAVARFAPWRGEARFWALGTIVLLVLGLAWFVLGAAELAWVWLVPAAALALAPSVARRVPRGGVLAWPCVALAIAPVLAVLHPLRLREAAWNGFLPAPLPLSVGLVVLAIPLAAGVAWTMRRRTAPGPMETLLLGLGCALLAIVGLVVALALDPACTAAEFGTFHLTCERV